MQIHLRVLVWSMATIIFLVVATPAQRSVDEVKGDISKIQANIDELKTEVEIAQVILNEFDKGAVACGGPYAIASKDFCSAWIAEKIASGDTSRDWLEFARNVGKITRTMRNVFNEIVRENEQKIASLRGQIATLQSWVDLHGDTTTQQTTTVTGYTKGRSLGSATLPGNKAAATDVVFLEKGKKYIVVGEKSVSSWDGQEDGCDSVFRYKAPYDLNGEAKVVWGQMRFVNPNTSLADLLEAQLGRKLDAEKDYRPSHIYETVITGEGMMLQAFVSEGGPYVDNHGELKVTVFEAIPNR